MGELVDLKHKISKFYKFTPNELKGMIISIIVLGFIISFKDWGKGAFNPAAGLFNFFNAILIVALSLLVHDAFQRIWGLAIGYRIEFKMWTFGLVIALIVAFITRGEIWLLIPGGFLMHHLAGHRLGFFRYGTNYFPQAMIAMAGSVATLILIIILKILDGITPSSLLEKAIIFNLVYLITYLLPIPPLDGSKMFFGSRMVYAFVFTAMIAMGILLMVDLPIFLSIVLSLLVGVVLWLVYYISFERKVWTGPPK